MEFGNAQFPAGIGSTVPAGTFTGPPPDGSTTDVTGPLHNQIPAPGRRVDNSTLWQADYDVAHYEDMYFTRMANYYETMYFTRMANYYETQSSNRYSVKGDVNGWVKGRSTRRCTAATTAASSSATPRRRWFATRWPSGVSTTATTRR